MTAQSKTWAADFSDLLGEVPSQQTFEPASSQMVSEAELALRWGVTPRQVRQLVQERIIERISRSRFDAEECTRRYIRHLIGVSQRRGTVDPDLRAEKLRLTREQADAVELKNAIARNETLSAKAVEDTWAGILRDVRAGMLSIPGRLAGRLNLSALDLAEIDREIRTALEAMGNENA